MQSKKHFVALDGVCYFAAAKSNLVPQYQGNLKMAYLYKLTYCLSPICEARERNVAQITLQDICPLEQLHTFLVNIG